MIRDGHMCILTTDIECESKPQDHFETGVLQRDNNHFHGSMGHLEDCAWARQSGKDWNFAQKLMSAHKVKSSSRSQPCTMLLKPFTYDCFVTKPCSLDNPFGRLFFMSDIFLRIVRLK